MFILQTGRTFWKPNIWLLGQYTESLARSCSSILHLFFQIKIEVQSQAGTLHTSPGPDFKRFRKLVYTNEIVNHSATRWLEYCVVRTFHWSLDQIMLLLLWRYKLYMLWIPNLRRSLRFKERLWVFCICSISCSFRFKERRYFVIFSVKFKG